MNQLGRGAKATAAQRSEVERLAAEGMSLRKIAAEVFGDPRFRGRVERILRRQPNGNPLMDPPLADPALEELDVSELEPIALIRLLFERRLAWLATSGQTPSMSELRNLLEVERRLAAAEAVERLKPKPRDPESGRDAPAAPGRRERDRRRRSSDATARPNAAAPARSRGRRSDAPANG